MDPKVTVVGCGRLGLCLALCMDRAGYEVLAVEKASSYVDALNERSYSTPEPQVDGLLRVCRLAVCA